MGCGPVSLPTAPSMDGYASNSSAMIVDGVKITIYNQTPRLVLGDLDILANAPQELRGAGIGDMAAKAISIAEWQIAYIVNGEYFCPPIAGAMLTACGKAVQNAEACMLGDADAVRELTEGLILSGVAMSMAQVSRPASGSEHTLSHLMDMLSIARKTPHRLHGVQVGYGVRAALFAYEVLADLRELPADPDAVLRQFDAARWEQDMRRMFGDQADGLIQAAQNERRNTETSLQKRALAARTGWAEIQAILRETLTQRHALNVALDAAGIPALQNPEALGLKKEDVLDLFIHAKDLRARYILPSMAFDSRPAAVAAQSADGCAGRRAGPETVLRSRIKILRTLHRRIGKPFRRQARYATGIQMAHFAESPVIPGKVWDQA